MKKITKKVMSILAASIAAGSLVTMAFASGSVGSGATVKGRINNSVTAGQPLSQVVKGVKQFGVNDTTFTRVVDENGVAPLAGQLVAIEVANTNTPGTCYAMVFDSNVASDTTESGSVNRMIVPPLFGVTSQLTTKEFTYPKQFHKGLVVASKDGCRVTVGWTPIGGNN